MKTKIGIIGICLALLLGLGVGVIGADESNTLTVAIMAWDYDTIDPHVSSFRESQYMIMCYCDTLFRLNAEDGAIYPGLAESWESQENSTVWEVHLREGVTFHDGTPWNAQAFVANIYRVLDPGTKSKAFASKIQTLERMQIVDSMTVKLHFAAPYGTFPTAMSEGYFGFLSPTAFFNPENTETADKLVGTGPFKLVKSDYREEVVFERNPNYTWGPEEYIDHKGPASIDKIVFHFIPEDAARVLALRSGQVDWIDYVPTTDVPTIMENPNTTISTTIPCGWGHMIHINVQQAPTDELAVRQALSLAIDREALNQALFSGLNVPLHGIEEPGSSYTNPAVMENPYFYYDLERAGKLLTQAGWIDTDGDGIREKNGEDLFIRIIVPDEYIAIAPAEFVQAEWRKVGGRMTVDAVSGPAMMTEIPRLGTPYNGAVRSTHRVDVPGVYARYCLSSGMGTANYSHYSSPELDLLINTALGATDVNVRRQALYEVQEIIADEMLIIPLFGAVQQRGTTSRLHGVQFLANSVPVFWAAYLE